MSDAEAYLRDLRRALPIGCRRRFVAEVREHFESAVAAEAERGVVRADGERLTIERLGPARVLAEQLLADMRSGVLGPVARLSAALTVTRIALAAVLALAVVVGVAVVSVRSSSKTPPPTVQRLPDAGVVHNGVLVRRLVLTLSTAVRQRGKRRALPSGYVVVPRPYYAQSR